MRAAEQAVKWLLAEAYLTPHNAIVFLARGKSEGETAALSQMAVDMEYTIALLTSSKGLR